LLFIEERRKMMKKTIVILAVMLLLSTAAVAAVGPVEGKKFEFSTAFSFSVQKYNYGDGYTETDSIFNIPLRLGYFIWKGLEFEPELMMTSYHDKYVGPGFSDTSHSTGWLLSGNLLYNFTLNKSPRMLPFILAGYGFGNGFPVGGNIYRYETGAKSSCLNLGVGLKYLFGNIAALRLEYRFLGGRVKYPIGEGTGNYTDKFNQHGLFVGLSLFF
jgi:opacity protein-like surface antigen